MYICFHKKTTDILQFGILISKLSSIDAQISVFCTYYLYKNLSKNKIFLLIKYQKSLNIKFKLFWLRLYIELFDQGHYINSFYYLFFSSVFKFGSDV